MPTNTWEPTPRQSDTETGRRSRDDEPGNFETPRPDDAGNYDATRADEWRQTEDEDINRHGSER